VSRNDGCGAGIGIVDVENGTSRAATRECLWLRLTCYGDGGGLGARGFDVGSGELRCPVTKGKW
jgi:hypothetical protein